MALQLRRFLWRCTCGARSAGFTTFLEAQGDGDRHYVDTVRPGVTTPHTVELLVTKVASGRN